MEKGVENINIEHHYTVKAYYKGMGGVHSFEDLCQIFALQLELKGRIFH